MRRKGAAAVEMAFVLPVFLLVVFATVNFGRIFMVRHIVQMSTSQAARTCAVVGPWSTAADRLAAQVKATADINRDCATAGVTPTISFVETRDPTATDEVYNTTVTVRIPYNQFSLWPSDKIYVETRIHRSER